MASSSRRIGPTGVGMALVGVVVLVILAAMFVAGDYRQSGYRIAEKIEDFEPMESRGKWLGMHLADTNTRGARALRVPPHVKGVVVTNMNELAAGRARNGGVKVGDVITRIDGKKVNRLQDVHKITKKLNVARPVMLDVLVGGQPMTRVVPGATRQRTSSPVAWQRPMQTMQRQWSGGVMRNPVRPMAFVPQATTQPRTRAPVRQPYAPVAQPYAPVAQPYAPVAQPYAPVVQQRYVYVPVPTAQQQYMPRYQPYQQYQQYQQPRYVMPQPYSAPLRR